VISDENELTNAYGLRIADIPTSVQGDRYAITTGGGVVQIGDHQEWLVQTTTPAASPPADFIKVYPKLDGGDPRLFAKDASGVEHLLTGDGQVQSFQAWQRLASAAASISLSSIPQDADHLLLLLELDSDNSGIYYDSVRIVVNGDTTAANYHSHTAAFTGSYTPYGVYGTQPGIILYGGALAQTAPANHFSAVWLSILDYSKSGYPHTFHFHGGLRTGASAFAQLLGTATWAGTGAITSLQIIPQAGSQWQAGSAYQVWLLGG